MDGTETREEKQRCRIWDLLWNFGALHVEELGERAQLRKDRVLTLLDHCWFTPIKGGIVDIAKVQGTGRRMMTNCA